MLSVKVKNIIIGEGTPKICIPVLGKTYDEILKSAKSAKDHQPDIIEWRADWYDGVFSDADLTDVLKKLRSYFEETPLLVTFRTKAEGGEKEISKEDYSHFVRTVAGSGCADLIDLELFIGEDTFNDCIKVAHDNNLYVVASNHDFHATPTDEEIINRLKTMDEKGADILKIAVMPNDPADVLTILKATYDMHEKYTKKPLITMSMGELGLITRLSGKVFGSAVTFGSAGVSSAPGQINALELRKLLYKE